MSRIVRQHCGWLIVTQLAMLPVRVWATEPATNADELFRDGRRELLAGHYEAACDLLQRSDALDPAPGTKLNLGECESSRGHLVAAWGLFKLVENQLLPSDARYPVARSKREALEPRLPRLQLMRAEGAPKELRVRIGEQEFDATELAEPIPLDPGQVSLLVTAPGIADQRIEVLLEEGKTIPVTIGSTSLPNPAVSAPPTTTNRPSPAVTVSRTPATPARLPRAASSQARTGTAVLTVGIVGIAVGATTGIMALDAKRTNQDNCSSETESCNQRGRDAAQRGRVLGAVTTTALLVGGAGAVLGTYLIVTAQGENGQSTRLSMQPTWNGARVSLERSF